MEVFNKDGTVGKILGDLVELRKIVGGLKAEKKQYVPFPVKSAKDLVIKLRKGLDELQMHLFVVRQEVTHLPYTTDAKGNNVTTTHVVTTIRFVSSDGTFIESVGSGHGGSTDDKAGGKASTYAYKDAIIKALTTPDDEMVDTDDEVIVTKPAFNSLESGSAKKFNFGKKN